MVASHYRGVLPEMSLSYPPIGHQPTPLSGRELCLGVASFTRILRSGAIDVFQILPLARNLAINWIELCDKTFLRNDRTFIRRISLELDRHQMQLAAIDIRNDFTLENEARRLEEIRNVNDWVDVCALLGVPIARIWIGSVNSGPRATSRATECLVRVAEHAEARQITLALENHGGISSDPDTLLNIVDLIRSPHLKVCADFGWLAAGVRLSGLRKLIPRAAHLHAKAHRFDAHGREPDIDFKEIGLLVRQAQYHGLISIEYEGKGNFADCVSGVELTAKLVRQYFALNQPHSSHAPQHFQ